ncbi:MAG: hypothetical protein OEV76_07245, partial [Anaerolineae bacterium]|nr:hypothetical protein [Anaerolineae bacterium]
EIEGYVGNVDINFGPILPISVSWAFSGDDWRNVEGVAVTVGPGIGASASHTMTGTHTVGTTYAWLKEHLGWLFGS